MREGNALPPVAADGPNAQARARARERAAGHQSVAFDAVTQGARAGFRFTLRAIAMIDCAGSLADAQPPSLRQDRAWHHKCAGHYQAGLIRWPRLLWGYIHLLAFVPVFRFSEWVTKSPARALVAAAILAAFWFGR